MAGEGFKLVITKEELKRIENADKNIENLGTTAEQTRTKVIAAFNAMIKEGVNPFRDSLKEAKTEFVELKTADLIFKKLEESMKKLGNQSKNTGKDVGDLVTQFAQLKTQTNLNPYAGLKEMNLGQTLAQLKSLQTLLKDPKLSLDEASLDFLKRRIELLKEFQKESLKSKETINSEERAESERKENEYAKERLDNLNKLVAEQKTYEEGVKRTNKELEKSNEQQRKFAEKSSEQRAITQDIAHGYDESQLQKEWQDAQKAQDNYYDNWGRAEDEKRREEERSKQEKIRALEEINKQQEEQARQEQERIRQENSTFAGSIAFSKKAQSINEEKQAIEYLTIARDNLNKSDKDYQKNLDEANRRILQHKINIDNATSASNRLQKAHSNILQGLGPLGNKLALVFSFSAISGYLSQMVNVRAEFELQNRALQAILQNKEQADALFDRITQLAVRSPYRVKDLVTYTKQLAAYRVEEEKLYDTTKMLADVSSGLGVDMQRLILAYGQVKAANYLRGQELRQFSEAGINILGELAQYFSELEGRAISTGEIFERVSKRMVSFEDVGEVFKRITEEGGIFYNMQEIQAETLRGQISNLRDSIDIMFNEIGKGNEGVLKNSVKLIRTMIEHWEEIARILKVAGGAFGVYIAYVVLAGVKQKIWTASTIEAMAAQRGLNGVIATTIKGMNALFSTGGIITIAIAALAILGSHIIQVHKEQKEANKEFAENIKKLNASRAAAQSYTPALVELAKQQKNLLESSKSDKKAQEELAEVRAKQRNILNELAEIDADYARRVRGRLNDEQELIKLAKEYNQELETRMTLEAGMGVNQLYLTKQYDKASEAYAEALSNMQSHYQDFVIMAQRKVEAHETGLQILPDAQYKAYKDFLDASSGSIQDRLVKLYRSLSQINVNLNKSLGGYKGIIEEYNRASVHLTLAEDAMLQRFKMAAENAKVTPGVQAYWKQFTDTSLSQEDRQKARNAIIAEYNKVLDTSYLSPDLQKKAKEFLLSLFPGFGTWEVTVDDNLSYLQEQMSKYIEKNKLDDTRIFPKINATTDTDNYFKELQNRYKELNDEAGRARIATESLSETMSNEEFAQSLEKQAQNVKNFLLAFGYDDDSKANKQMQLFKQRLQLLQDMYKKYIDLRKNFSGEEAYSKVKKSYTNIFNDLFGSMGWNINDFDFTTLQGVLVQLGKLDNQAKKLGKEAVRELDDAMGDTEVQIDVKIRQDAREDLQRDIADLFDGYEIATELDKLDIPADLAQQIFGLQATSLPQIQAIIEQWHEANLFIGEDGEKVYKDTMERIADMEDRENRERLKKYLTLLNDATDARITIKQKELRELREIDKLENVPEPERNLMREKVRENAEKELLQQQWKEFKDSDLYVQMFENLDKASMKSLGVMRSQLEEMRASLSNLDPANAKEVARAIERIDEATHNRHPLRYLNEDLKKAQEYIANRQTWEKALTDAMTRAAELTQSRNDAADIAAGWWDQYQKYSDQGLTNEASYSYIMWQKAHDVTERYAKQLEETNKEIDKYTRKLSLGQRAMQNYCDTLIQMCEWTKEVSNLMEEFAVLSMETYGKATTSAEAYARIVGETVENVANLAANIVKIVASGGADVSAWIAAGGAIAGIWRNINDFIDRGKLDIIEEEQRAIDQLTWAYARLEEQIDKALTLEAALVSSDQMLQNIEMRRQAIEAQLAAEEERKNTDENEINKYKQQLIELEDEAERAKSKMMEAFGGIGSENYASQAASIVTAWVDAYKNGTNTLDAINGKFDEFIDNLLKKQLQLRYAGRYIEQIMSEFDSMFEDDGVASREEMLAFREMKDKAVADLDARMREWMEIMGYGQGYENEGLTSLQRGIQGVTEKEAEVIESYLNGVRSNQMTMNTNITNIYNALTAENSEIIRNLKYAKKIYDLLFSLSAESTSNGRVLKVKMV